jgi:hypothetical protein
MAKWQDGDAAGRGRSCIVDWTSIVVHIRSEKANKFGGSAGGITDHFGSDELYKTIR